METLLTHRDWVRRLARSLVHDDASADDVVQRTWLTALRFPPRRAETARAWLACIVRSQVSNARRDERRRGAREFAAARREATRSAADVVAEAESHKRLVLAVMSLDEPYRATVLLRWFEDLPPRDVAARMGVPVETVRTRLRRAHEELRTELGGGPGIAFVLAPLVALRPEWTATTAATAAGGTIVGTKTAVTVGAVVLAFGGGFLVHEVAGGGGASSTKESAEVASQREAAPAQAAPKQDADRRPQQAEGRRVAALQQQVADQQAQIDALESSLAALKATSEKGTAARAASAVEAAAAETKRAALDSLSDSELLAHIRTLVSSSSRGTPVDGKAVLDACALLLARPLDVTTRADGLIQKGIGHRVMQDAAAEETAFREALELAGPRTTEGRSAATQLAWTAYRKGEPRSAADQFLAVSQDPDAPPRQRAWNRYYAATNYERANDKVRARAEFQGVVEEFGASADKDALKAAELAGAAIKRMDSSAGGR